MRGSSYATEGVERFVSEVLKIDNTDFVGKMEGFAVQGLKGRPFFRPDNILNCFFHFYHRSCNESQATCI